MISVPDVPAAPSRGLRLAGGWAALREGATRHRRPLAAALWVALGAAAVYLLVPQSATLTDGIVALARVHPGSVFLVVLLVAARYATATLSLQAAVSRPIAFVPTLLVQLAASFVGRLTPEGVGWLILNQRYLERTGLARASAGAAIALKVIAGAIARVAVMLLVAIMVGGDVAAALGADGPLLLASGGAAVVVLALAAVAARRARHRLGPVLVAARDLRAVLRQPRRAAVLLASSAGVTLSYAVALAASVAATGVDTAPIQVVAVYLGGTAVAALSPTPGNVGAIEVALVGGLTAVGVPSAEAVSGVLLFRLVTFWLPILPGFLAFRMLLRRGDL